jgi:hypothetical protein
MLERHNTDSCLESPRTWRWRYSKGRGSTDKADNFSCREPKHGKGKHRHYHEHRHHHDDDKDRD